MKFYLLLFLLFAVSCVNTRTDAYYEHQEKSQNLKTAINIAHQIGKGADTPTVHALLDIVEKYNKESVECGVHKAIGLARDKNRYPTLDEIDFWCEYYDKYAIR